MKYSLKQDYRYMHSELTEKGVELWIDCEPCIASVVIPMIQLIYIRSVRHLPPFQSGFMRKRWGKRYFPHIAVIFICLTIAYFLLNKTYSDTTIYFGVRVIVIALW